MLGNATHENIQRRGIATEVKASYSRVDPATRRVQTRLEERILPSKLGCSSDQFATLVDWDS